jgi:putative ABC transport system ATP-binding protein
MSLFALRDISRRFEQSVALVDVTLSIAPGEVVALAGPSGSGKTTLLNLLGLIDSPSTGTLHFDGADVSALSSDALTQLRRQRLAFVFQSLNLMPVLSAAENVEYFLLRQGVAHASARALEALEAVGLAKFAGQRASRLSGGQQQRVAIAQALARKPQVVLADEPTAALDHRTGADIIDLLLRLNSEQNVTVIFSSHDPKVINAARRVIALEDGRLTGGGA